MTAAALVATARTAGVSLSRRGNHIHWSCDDDPPPGLLERIAAARLDVLAALDAEAQTPPLAAWTAALAALADEPPPRGLAEAAWRQAVRQAQRFALRHGAACAAAGWTFAELFAVPEFWGRLDGRGAAFLGLADAAAVEITPAALRWRTPSGATHTRWKAGRAPHENGGRP